MVLFDFWNRYTSNWSLSLEIHIESTGRENILQEFGGREGAMFFVIV